MSDPSWDAYFIPGTHAMRNKFTRGGRFPDGIPSMVAVGALEEHWARLRLIELVRSPPPGPLRRQILGVVATRVMP